MEVKQQDSIDAIAPPSSLSQQQIAVAKSYVKEKMLEGFTVQDFCSKHGISTKTLYSDEWLRNPLFTAYISEVQDVTIPADEAKAYQKIKRHILGISSKQNPSIKEIELFLSTFSYLAESDKRKQMSRLGLSNEAIKSDSHKTLEEKKAALFKRLEVKGK